MLLQEWLENKHHPFEEGVKLYQKLGSNTAFKEMLVQQGEHSYNRKRLFKELTELARSMQVDPTPTDTNHAPPTAEAGLDSSASRQHAFFPTTRSHKPKVAFPVPLHPVHDRLMELMALINDVHPKMAMLYNINRGESHQCAQTLIHAWDEVEECYKILNYWEDHQEVLPHKYGQKKEAIYLTDADKLRRRNNLRSNISKHRHNPAKADRVNAWRTEMEELNRQLK